MKLTLRNLRNFVKKHWIIILLALFGIFYYTQNIEGLKKRRRCCSCAGYKRCGRARRNLRAMLKKCNATDHAKLANDRARSIRKYRHALGKSNKVSEARGNALRNWAAWNKRKMDPAPRIHKHAPVKVTAFTNFY